MIGITLPGADAFTTIANIKAAEAAGIPSAWLTTAGAGLDALTIYAAVTRETQSITFGASIVPTWPRHPIVVAQQAQVIEQLAPGRLIVGVGPSNQPSMEALIGVDWRSPQQHLREYIVILKDLLQKGEVDFQGSHFTARARIAAPVQVPIMAGTLREGTYKLVGEVADGAISWLTPWPYIRDLCLPAMRSAAAAAGRETPALVVHAPFCISEDVEAVRAAVRQQFGFYPRSPAYAAMFEAAGFKGLNGEWSDELIDAVVAHGTAAAVSKRLSQLLSEGATDVIAHPLFVADATQDEAFALVSEANRLSVH